MNPHAPPDLLDRLRAAANHGLRAIVDWAGVLGPMRAPGDGQVRVDVLPDRAFSRDRHRRQVQQAMVLTGGMAAVIVVAATLLAGWWGLALAAASVIGIVTLGPRMEPEAVMKTYGGEPVEAANGATFLDLVDELSRRAALPRSPALYVIPSATLNAFSVGTSEQATIVLTEGLIRRLQMRELAAMLAHEISHIRKGDLWILQLADGMTRVGRILFLSALALMTLNLVSVFTGVSGMSWLGLLLLFLVPAASSLLQQRADRSREFDADRGAVALTGDRLALVQALGKLAPDGGNPWEDLVFAMRLIPQPSLLRSHPPSGDRIALLQQLVAPAPSDPPPWPPLIVVDGPLITASAGIGASALEPRYRWLPGVWY